jgi:hypothetical protein
MIAHTKSALQQQLELISSEVMDSWKRVSPGKVEDHQDKKRADRWKSGV